ncbi:MAG: HAD hydrolase family protein, partial [Firmicutes bacterium]|nr:HAD hydrolase family protein [Bacillota bacterium]
TVTSSMSYNLEIGGANTSKANALLELSKISGIPLRRVMSFGDSPNDSAMIIESGFGVAMGNAEDEVKDQADYVTLTCDEEGVVFAIRRLLFKNI